MSTTRPAGRPAGSPSRSGRQALRTEPQTAAETLAQALAVGSLMPSLNAQFEALDPGAQLRLFGVLDQIGGMSHGEKLEVQTWLHAVREMEGVSVEFVDLLNAVARLVFYVDRLAHPASGDSAAEAFIAEWAARNGRSEKEAD